MVYCLTQSTFSKGKKMNQNYNDGEFFSELCQAVSSNSYDTVTILLHCATYASFEWTNARIVTIFNLAAETKLDAKIYQWLFTIPQQTSVLTTDLLPKDTDYGYMLPVHVAAKHGNIEFLSNALSSGRFDLQETIYQAYTTLHIATQERHIECV
jgi:hypothetical protein